MKKQSKFFLCLIAILASFALVSCGGDILPEETDGLPLVSSDDLQAWRDACIDHAGMKHNTTDEVNVQVTGTVVTAPDSSEGTKYTYIADETGVGLIIYGNYKNNVPYEVGDIVTLKINKIKFFGADFQTDDNNVTVVEKTAGTRPEPKQINTQAEFNALKESNLAFVTFYGRVASTQQGGRTYEVNILTKAEYDELLEHTDLQTDKVEPVEDKVVTVYPYGKTDVNYGDICKFTGHVGLWKEDVQVKTFGEITKGFERIQAEPVNGTITQFVEAAKSGKTRLDNPLKLTGIPTYVNTKNYREMILVEKGTSNSISIYIPRDNYFKDIELGKPVSLTVYSIDESFGMTQCSTISDLKQDTTAASEIENIRANAIKITSLAKYKEYAKYRDYLALEGTISKVDKSNYTLRFADNTEVTVYISSKIAKFAEGDSVTVYGNAGLFKEEHSLKVTDAKKN